VVFLSTDYVFDGKKLGEYTEDDPPAPINAYGRTKLTGEEAVRAGRENLIVRTSWVFGDGTNFVKTILHAARGGRPLRVVDDQRGRPTWAQDLATALAHVVRSGATGVLHVAGDGEPGTWADLAEAAVGAAGLTLPVEGIDSETYGRTADRVVAPRPANSVLSLERARAAHVPLGDWRCSVHRYVEGLA
jgi:dTDP-4-dehydrorhamnose reductase